MNNKQIFGIITAIILMLTPMIIGLSYATKTPAEIESGLTAAERGFTNESEVFAGSSSLETYLKQYLKQKQQLERLFN